MAPSEAHKGALGKVSLDDFIASAHTALESVAVSFEKEPLRTYTGAEIAAVMRECLPLIDPTLRAAEAGEGAS